MKPIEVLNCKPGADQVKVDRMVDHMCEVLIEERIEYFKWRDFLDRVINDTIYPYD